MANYTYGEKNQKRAWSVFVALINYACQASVTAKDVRWKGELTICFKTNKPGLQKICGTITSDTKKYEREIRPAISHYLSEFLGILETKHQRAGSNSWQFDLKLWSREPEENLRPFDGEWEKKKKSKNKITQPISERSTYPHCQKGKQIVIVESTKSIKELWIQLKELGTYAPERMGVYVAENDVEKVNALPEGYQSKPFLDEVPKGTQGLKFKIVSEGMGNVLLLNYDDEEKVVYCFCPSRFAPNMSLDLAPSMSLHRGETIVPQKESTFPYLGAKRQGREDWWGWIVGEMPPLSWLGAARDTALRLNTEQLAELLSQVELQQGEVLHTFYRVI